MKNVCLIILLTCAISPIHAQHTPQILTTPSDWKFEQFPLPPDFALDVKYHGLEELRFSPGWGNRQAKDYFTVIFGIRFEDVKTVSAADIKDYLLTYFKGLCTSTARNNHIIGVDAKAITVSMEKKPGTGKTIIYKGTLHIFGVFTDGQPLTLNMEIKENDDAAHKKVYLHMVASPLPTTDAVWQQLHKEQALFGGAAH